MPTQANALVWVSLFEMVFAWLLGNWVFERTVTPHASVRGEAGIVLVSAGEALYCERARVTLATGEELRATQKYLYRQRELGFDIFFAETGLLFQSLRFRQVGGNLVATATHACVADHYSSEYVVCPPNRMVVRHVVRGPAKNYVSVTEFARGSFGATGV